MPVRIPLTACKNKPTICDAPASASKGKKISGAGFSRGFFRLFQVFASVRRIGTQVVTRSGYQNPPSLASDSGIYSSLFGTPIRATIRFFFPSCNVSELQRTSTQKNLACFFPAFLGPHCSILFFWELRNSSKTRVATTRLSQLGFCSSCGVANQKTQYKYLPGLVENHVSLGLTPLRCRAPISAVLIAPSRRTVVAHGSDRFAGRWFKSFPGHLRTSRTNFTSDSQVSLAVPVGHRHHDNDSET